MVGLLLLGAAPAENGSLTFEERVNAEKAIQRTFHGWRLWPDANGHPRPSFERVVRDEELKAQVRDTLDKSAALELFWDQPVTARQLQGELDRMAGNTRDPERLSQLFAALGNDVARVAETLARPRLVERRIRNLYARDA